MMRRLESKLVLLLAMALLIVLSGHAQAPDAYAKGLSNFRAGDYAQAAESFQKADAAAPGTTDALVLAAKAFVHLEKFGDADGALRSYLRLKPASPEALFLLGYVLHRENRPADSLEVYTKAAALQKPTGDDLKIVGLNYVLVKDYSSAIHWLEKAVEVDPINAEGWYFLGRAYYTRSRMREAQAAFEKVLKLNPTDAKAENNIGLILESEARPAEAIDAYKLAIQWQERSHQNEQPYLNLGSILLDQERNEEALAALAQAVKLAPTSSLCHLKFGIANLRLSKLGDAQKELEEAVRLDPENSQGHFQLGKLYKQMHAMDRAKKEFSRAEEIESRTIMSSEPKP